MKKDGSFVVASKSHVRIALERIEALDKEILVRTAPLKVEREELQEAVNKYVIDHYEASDGYEDSNFRATKVVGHTRSWNPDKLQKLLPTRLYKLVIIVKVDSGKLDELVREGKIDRKKIEKAYEEKPNTPYVKMTKKDQSAARAAGESESLAEALG